MPYISQKDREKWDDDALEEIFSKIDHCGELNYMFTKIFHAYINRHGLRYQSINDISGAIKEANAEFRRRITSTYEDKKIDENGDVMGINLLK